MGGGDIIANESFMRVKNDLPDSGDRHDVPLGGDVEVPQVHRYRYVVVCRYLERKNRIGTVQKVILLDRSCLIHDLRHITHESP